MSRKINISSAPLKVLELSNCSNLKEVNVEAPNLLSCGYCGDGASKPVISFLKSSSQLEVNVLFHIDFMYLGNLREFIQNFKPKSVLASLSLFIHQPIKQKVKVASSAEHMKVLAVDSSNIESRYQQLGKFRMPSKSTLHSTQCLKGCELVWKGELKQHMVEPRIEAITVAKAPFTLLGA
ncbi:hypothetical protein CR513_12303, partial [Mucuna pruriens]